MGIFILDMTEKKNLNSRKSQSKLPKLKNKDEKKDKKQYPKAVGQLEKV